MAWNFIPLILLSISYVPPAINGVPHVDVTFDIDADGMLLVSATNTATGQEHKINIDVAEVHKMKEQAMAPCDAKYAPISLHPKNPHYFSYRNKPTILITSAEHYGALINLDFDYKLYLNSLHADGLNMTRIFTGAYVEPRGAFDIEGNSLSPAANSLITPWARSVQPGYSGGGNKFDLSRWNEEYFARLKAIVALAREKGIIVELTFFCPFYEDFQWDLSPMNSQNNINNLEKIGRTDVHTMDKNGQLLAFQDSLVSRLVTDLNCYDNVIFEICNEPYWGGVTMDWQHHIASLIHETETNLKRKHLISQNIANDSALIKNPHPAVSVFNFHYATPPRAVKQNYHLNKVIGDNETGFKGQDDSTYRKEGWEIILAGGALYNNLDYSFATSFENGTYAYPPKQPGGGSVALRAQLSHLTKFMKSFDFISMKPDYNFITGGLPQGARANVLAKAGKQYAGYIVKATQVALEIALPAGKYTLEWLDPVTGKYTSKQILDHQGNTAKISSPSFTFDIAFRILSTK